MAKANERDMTQGGIVSNLVNFALPLLLGNLFQQLYNMVDTWVIGQTGQNGAYAAVGSVGPIINILIGFFSGLATGAGVVISRYYGAGEKDKLRKAVHASAMLTLVLCVVFTLLGVLGAPLMLRLMLHGEAGDVYASAYSYLVIYFAGVSGLMIYNMGAGILRAVGDSRRPFYYLCVAAVINTVLDLVFVFQFQMGVAGVAYATIIAQFASAVLTVITLLRTDSAVKIVPKEIRFHGSVLAEIIKVGFPTALQMAITAFSNVFVQSYIAGVNGDQTVALAGWTTYAKLDQFMFLPIQSIALAATTFVGQNLGKGNVARAKKGTKVAYLMSTGVTAFFIAVIMLLSRPLSALFNPDPAVMDCAIELLLTISPFYLLSCINQTLAGALRGAGNSRAPMIIMLGAFVGFRQIFLYIMSTYISNDLLPIAMGYPAGWFVSAVLMIIFYARFRFEDAVL